MTREEQREFTRARDQYLRTWDALQEIRRGASFAEAYRIDRTQQSLTRTFLARYPRSAR